MRNYKSKNSRYLSKEVPNECPTFLSPTHLSSQLSSYWLLGAAFLRESFKETRYSLESVKEALKREE